MSLAFATKPYSGPGDHSLPPKVRELPTKKRRQWVSVFNSSYGEHHDEGRAFASAYSAVGEKALEGILVDDAFWAEFRRRLGKVAAPIFLTVYTGGIEAGQHIRPLREKAEGAPVYLDIDIAVVNAAADDYIRNYMFTWLAQVEESTKNQLREAITIMRRDGLGIEYVIAKADALFGTERAQSIAVTETTRLFGQGAQAAYRAAGLEQWSWQTVRDSFVDSSCSERQGEMYPIGETFEPLHPRCVAAGTYISGPPVFATYSRRYDGEGVVLVSSLGDELTITPNHPIATPTGWRNAGDLREGDYILADTSQWMPMTDPNEVEMPTRVEEIAEALLRSGGLRAAPCMPSAEDFHGDGLGGKVDIVWANSLPEDRVYSKRFKMNRKPNFINTSRFAFGAQRVSTEFVEADYASSAGIMRRSNLHYSLLRRHISPFHKFGFTLSTNVDFGGDEACSNSRSADVQSSSHLNFGNSRLIEPDDIDLNQIDFERGFGNVLPHVTTLSSARRIRFSGQVYNLETSEGWYTANGIITHNCRCFPRPVVVDAS